jgi:hypothetical protein
MYMKRLARAWETKWKTYLTWKIVSKTDAIIMKDQLLFVFACTLYNLNFFGIIQDFHLLI